MGILQQIWANNWNQRLENLGNAVAIIAFLGSLIGFAVSRLKRSQVWKARSLLALAVSMVGFVVVLFLRMGWRDWLALIWLAVLTVHVWLVGSSSRRISAGRFKDGFEHGLDQWEYQGEWKTERDDSHHILLVTNSFHGGYALPCRLWHDYIFEFETKIVQANSAWIIRASDTLNYVMLQCGQGEIIPHFKVDGRFYKLDAITLLRELPLGEWFAVAIKVLNTRVVVNITFEGEKRCILDLPLLRPQVHKARIPDGATVREVSVPCSFPLGSVGFREAGYEECAYFRNVRVTRSA